MYAHYYRCTYARVCAFAGMFFVLGADRVHFRSRAYGKQRKNNGAPKSRRHRCVRFVLHCFLYIYFRCCRRGRFAWQGWGHFSLTCTLCVCCARTEPPDLKFRTHTQDFRLCSNRSLLALFVPVSWNFIISQYIYLPVEQFDWGGGCENNLVLSYGGF